MRFSIAIRNILGAHAKNDSVGTIVAAADAIIFRRLHAISCGLLSRELHSVKRMRTTSRNEARNFIKKTLYAQY